MELSLRPYVTAGVVVAGAGLIAAAPLGPSALEIQTRAVQLASVDAVADLTAGQEFPIASWTDVYNDTVSNLQSLEAQMTADPHPILSAIDANMTEYANQLSSAAQTSSSNLTNALQDLSSVLSNAWSDLQSGDVYDAETSIWQALLQDPTSVSRPFENAYFEITQSMVNNLDNVLSPEAIYAQTATSDIMSISAIPAWFGDLEAAPLYGPNAAEYAVAGVTQDIVNAWQSGDTSLALNDVSNALSTVADAYLNGYQVDDGGGGARLVSDFATLRAGLDPSEGALNGGSESVLRAKEIIAGDLGSAVRAEDATATAASASGDSNTLVGDISTLLNPDSALGEIVTAFDPNAVADLTSLLSGDLASNASGWAVDLFSLF